MCDFSGRPLIGKSKLAELEKELSGYFMQDAGDTMKGTLNMSGNSITNLATPINNADAANKSYVDSNIVSGGGTLYLKLD